MHHRGRQRLRLSYAVPTPLRFALEPLPPAPTIQGMATYRAISAIGNTVVGLLAEQCPKQEFPGAGFKLCLPTDFVPSKRLQFGISICLCRVSVNPAQRIPTPPPTPEGRRQRPPLALDLYFVMSAWAKTAERQHDLLGWAMCVLDDNPILPASALNRFAGGTGEVFGPEDSVRIVPEILSFEQMNSVAETMQLRQQPSIVYMARPVAIRCPDSQSVIVDGDTVRSSAGKPIRAQRGR